MDKNKKNQGVTITGCETGDVVVFLHSSLSSSKQWQSTLPYLEGDYKCIAIDILGYGDAPNVMTPEYYSLDTEKERILAIIDHCIGEQKFHLVGHSFGGANALKIALEHTERLLSLVVFEPIVLHFFEKGSEQRLDIEHVNDAIAFSSNLDAARIFTDVWNRPGFFDSLPKPVQLGMAEDIVKVRLESQAMVNESYLPEHCKKFSFPVGLVRGLRSPKFTHHVISTLLDNIPNATEFTIDCSHMGPITHPKEFNSALISIIKGID